MARAEDGPVPVISPYSQITAIERSAAAGIGSLALPAIRKTPIPIIRI